MFKKWNIQFKRVDIIFSALCSVQPSKTIVIILNSTMWCLSFYQHEKSGDRELKLCLNCISLSCLSRLSVSESALAGAEEVCRCNCG